MDAEIIEWVAVERAAVKEHQVIGMLEIEKTPNEPESELKCILYIVKQALDEKTK